MAKAEIFSGICGFTTKVAATMNGKACELDIQSDCKNIQKLAKFLDRIEPYNEISFQGSMPKTIEMSMRHCPHAACPVPVGIIKAIEVEAKLALPADVTIKVSKS